MKLVISKCITDDIYQKVNDFINIGFYHTKNWHCFLENTFKWKVKALLGYNDIGELIFFLPFITKRRLLKLVNIALPFSHKINFAYKENHFNIINNFFGSDFPLDTLEIHDEVKLDLFEKISNNFITVLINDDYKNFDNYYKQLDYKSIKYMVNRARKNGIYISEVINEKSLNDFYKLELATRKRQGSPMYPKNYFVNLINCFKDTDNIIIYIAYYDNKPVTGTIFFNFNKIYVYAYSASVADAKIKKLGANEFIMLNGIEKSFNSQIKMIDFGTTPLSLKSLLEYKEKWKGYSEKLNYSYYSKQTNVKQVKRDGLLVKLAGNIFKIMPDFLFERISPILLRLVI